MSDHFRRPVPSDLAISCHRRNVQMIRAISVCRSNIAIKIKYRVQQCKCNIRRQKGVIISCSVYTLQERYIYSCSSSKYLVLAIDTLVFLFLVAKARYPCEIVVVARCFHNVPRIVTAEGTAQIYCKHLHQLLRIC